MHVKNSTAGFEENSADLSSLGEERKKQKKKRKKDRNK